MIIYADDTVTYVPGKLSNDIESCLNKDFNAIVTWLESMDLRKGKTESMLFGTPQKIKKHNLNIVHRFSKLSTTSTYKGVLLNQSLCKAFYP